MRAPEFWQRRNLHERLAVMALTPFGWLYSATVAFKAAYNTSLKVSVPVICVGNISAGGVGKTPLSLALAEILKGRGLQPFFLSRGYGGKLTGPVRVMPEHNAVDVGDEPLLLATAAPVIVAQARAEGAILAASLGADAIVMDDGHQNFALRKDLSLVVIDATEGFGNGQVLPAGPLREKIAQGLKRADAVILIGDGKVNLKGFNGPVLSAHIRPTPPPWLKGAKVYAFAGIGNPDKFFRSLSDCGAEITGHQAFGDHHNYTQAEIASLRAAAHKREANLITTTKDYARLTETERDGIAVLPVAACFDDMQAIEALLNRVWPEGTHV